MDEFDELLARRAQKQSSSESGGNWISKLYDTLDTEWLPDSSQSGTRKIADWVRDRGFRRVGNVIDTVGEAQYGLANATAGSPLRLAGTAATLATAPLGAGARIAAAAPRAYRAIAGGARTIDAIDMLGAGNRGIEAAREGNYGAAAGNLIGAGMAGVGTVTPIGPNPRQPYRPVSQAPSIPNQPRPPIKPPVGVNQLDVSSQLPSPIRPAETQLPLPGTSQPPPTQFSRTRIARPEQLQLENTTELLKGKRVPDPSSNIMDEGTRKLDALGIPVNEKVINKYRSDTNFRNRIDSQYRKVNPNEPGVLATGERNVLQAPVPRMTPKEFTVDDVRQSLIQRGLQEPSDRFVAQIRKDPALMKSLGLAGEEMEGVVAPRNQIKGYLPVGKKELPEISNIDDGAVQGKLFDDAEPITEKLTKLEKEAPAFLREGIERAKTRFADQNILTRIGKSAAMSTEEELKRMGPRGAEIARLEQIRSVDSPILFNQYASEVEDALKGADKETTEKVVDYIEGKIPNASDDVKQIGDKLRDVFKRTGSELEGAGLLEKGKRGEDYFPRRYPEGFFKDTTGLKDKLRAEGYSEPDIDRIVNYAQEHGERKISAEFSRSEFNIPGYRKDKEAILEHLAELSNRVTTAKLYGAKDIADAQSPISQLVRNSEDPERAGDIMKRLLGRDINAMGSKGENEVARAAQNYASASFLSLFSISNLGGTLPIAVRSTIKDTASGLAQAFKTELPEMKFMENVNNYQNILGGVTEAYANNKLVSKLFGIEKSQNYMNRVAAGAFNGYAKSLFQELKANPNNRLVREQLSDLTLESADVLAKQSDLTQKQIERAMVRGADLTQGLNEGRKLPHTWNKQGILRVPQIFYRYNFQTTKTLKDAIKQNPANMVKLIAAGTVIGELLGDAKETIATVGEWGANQTIGDGSKEFLPTLAENLDINMDGSKGGRFDFGRTQLIEIDKSLGTSFADSPLAVRAFTNLQQSFALGIPFDMAQAMLDEEDFLANTTVMGGEFERIRELGGEALETGSFRNVGREAVKRVPYLGRGIAREIPTIRQQERGGFGSSKDKRSKLYSK